MNSWLGIQSKTKTTTQKTIIDIQQELDCLQFRHLDLRLTTLSGQPPFGIQQGSNRYIPLVIA